MNEMIENAAYTSSDDDNVPLAVLTINGADKVQNNSDAERSIELTSQQKNDEKRIRSKLNPPKDKHSKRKILKHKNKSTTNKSDSECSDPEKYTYFDKNRTKKTIKLKTGLSNHDIITQINAIKIENVCLKEERERINKIKLKERMMLLIEIRRLKFLLTEFNLSDHLKRKLLMNIGNTRNFIQIIEQHLNETNTSQLFSKIDTKTTEKYKFLKFTDLKFWNDFNNIEFNDESIYSKPLWLGQLDIINPNSEDYFEPDKDIMDYLKISEEYFKNDNVILDDTYSDVTENVNVKQEYVNDDEYVKSPSNDWYSSKYEDDEKYDQNVQESDTEMEKKVFTQSYYVPLCLEGQTFTYNALDCKLERNEIDQNIIQSIDIKNETLVNNDATEDVNESTNVTDGTCNECGLDNLWSSFIERYREAYQKQKKLTPCQTCNMKFLKSGHFDGTHRLKRPPVKKIRSTTYICDICGQGLATKSGLSQHRLKHSDVSYSCTICSFKCQRKGYIKIHMKTHSQKSEHKDSFETEEAPRSLLYFCKSCDYTAETFKLLKLHKVVHSSKKAFVCKQCPYSTNKSSALIQHERVHTKEKPFQCHHCTYKSSSKSYLTSHMRYHTGEKLFKCDMCPYRCVTFTRLFSHKKRHITEKPFKCDSCNCKFITKYELKVHSKKHKK